MKKKMGKVVSVYDGKLLDVPEHCGEQMAVVEVWDKFLGEVSLRVAYCKKCGYMRRSQYGEV